MTKVGDILYRHKSENSGRVGNDGDPLPMFDSHEIVAETKQSWMVGAASHKVNKKTLYEASQQRGYSGSQWYTGQGAEDWQWRNTHARIIAVCVEGQPIDKLKQIASIIGYNEGDKRCG